MNRAKYDKDLIRWANDHYWDSLEKDRHLILRHLRTFAGDFPQQAVTPDAKSLCGCDCHKTYRFKRTCCDRAENPRR
jgi:hypothetical protein